MALDGGASNRNPGPRFAIKRVIRTSLAVTYHNLFRFVAIIVAIAVPLLLLSVIARTLLASGVRNTGTGSVIDFSNQGTAILFLLIAGVLTMLSYLLIQSAITVGALLTLGGRPAAIGACLSQALAALPRLFLAGLVLFVGGGIVAGIVGLIVLQFFGDIGPDGKVAGDAATAFASSSLVIIVIALGALTLVWVFVPVLVVERTGPIACFQRSLALTKGRRGQIIAIVLLVLLVNGLISWVIKAVAENGAPMGGAALNVLAVVFFMALGAVLSAVGYATLRAEKEGSSAEDIARIL